MHDMHGKQTGLMLSVLFRNKFCEHRSYKTAEQLESLQAVDLALAAFGDAFSVSKHSL